MTENQALSIAVLTQKAEAGDAQAQFELACELSDFENSKNFADQALIWLTKAAEQQLDKALFGLALYYYLGLEDEYKRINIWLNELFVNKRKSAETIALSLAMRNEFKDHDFNRAFEYFQKSAAQNNVEAITWMGRFYRDGFGIEKDVYLAYKNFKAAAEQGLLEAQYELGCCYMQSIGVEKSHELAEKWFKKAMENGSIESEYELASIYIEELSEPEVIKLGVNMLTEVHEKNSELLSDRHLMLLANAYLNGMGGDKNLPLGLKFLEEIITRENDNTICAEAEYQAALMYFDGHGVEADPNRGIKYLSGAIKLHHPGAKQLLENAYLQFTFPEFFGRDDAEQCYEYAFQWLKKAYSENSRVEEVIFGLAVLYAFGAGVNKDCDKAKELFHRFHSGDEIDEHDPDHPREFSSFAHTYCYLHDDSAYWTVDYIERYFNGGLQSGNVIENDFVVLPAMVIDFLYEKSDLEHFQHYVRFLEKSNRVFEQVSTQKKLLSMTLKVMDLKEELERKNESLKSEVQQKESLQIKMQKLVEQFTHTLGNVIFPDTIYQVAERLKTNPNCRKDVLLLNEAYHSEIIIKLQGELLRQRYANTKPDKFRQMIRTCRRTAEGGDKTKSIADILDYAASRVTARFLNQHNASLGSIRDKIISQKNVSIDSLRQQFEDDILLNRTLGAVEWINQNLRPFKVVRLSPLWERVCILAESHAEALLFGYFSEVLFNAFKYADHDAGQFLTVRFDETVCEGKTYLTCSWCNPLSDKNPSSLGTGKGLDAILEDLRQLNDTEIDANSMLIAQDDKQFQVTMFFEKELLIDDVLVPDSKRKMKAE